MKVRVLKSAPFNETPKIRIVEGSTLWDAAYKLYTAGKNPTTDPEWKDGVFLTFEDVPDVVPQHIIMLNKTHIHTIEFPPRSYGPAEWDWIHSDHKRIRKTIPGCREFVVCHCTVGEDHESTYAFLPIPKQQG